MKLSTNIAVVLLAVVLLIGSACGQGFWANTVVCSSKAGFTVIEPGFNGICVTDLQETDGVSRFGGICLEAGCGPCHDVAFFQSQAYSNASAEGNSTPGVYSLSSNFQSEIKASSIFFTLYAKQIDFISPTLTSLQTVVILI